MCPFLEFCSIIKKMKNTVRNYIFCPLCLQYPLIDNLGLSCRKCKLSIKSKKHYEYASHLLKKEIKRHSLNCNDPPKIIFIHFYSSI